MSHVNSDKRMIELYQGSIDGVEHEYKSRIDGKWHTKDPAAGFVRHTAYRIKKQTRMIGDIEVPMPFTEKLEIGQKYWVAIVTHPSGYSHLSWDNDYLDVFNFNNGNCFKAEQDAIAVAEALIKLLKVNP